MKTHTSLLLSALVLAAAMAAPSARAGEFRRFPDNTAAEATRNAEFDDLRELLRQAQALRDEEASAKKAAAAAEEDADDGAPAKAPQSGLKSLISDLGAKRASDPKTDDAPEASRADAEHGAAAEVPEASGSGGDPRATGAADVDVAAPAAPEAPSEPAHSQAGCMYRKDKLIWEKSPGRCPR